MRKGCFETSKFTLVSLETDLAGKKTYVAVDARRKWWRLSTADKVEERRVKSCGVGANGVGKK